MNDIAINNRLVGERHPPLLVAEVGANHDGDVRRAETMLRDLAKAGAELVKFQLYSAGELLADPERIITWGQTDRERRESIGGLFDRLALPREALRDLVALGKELGVLVTASAFSQDGVAFLEKIGAPCHKVAASDVAHLAMLRDMAQTGKPVMLSLGKCTLAEADVAIETLTANGCEQIILFHCVAQYPAPFEEMNLRTIPTLAGLYPDCVLGLSDHSIGTPMGIASVALGARVIEKHITYDTNADGPDHWFSLPIAEVSGYIAALNHTFDALGSGRKRILNCESSERQTSVRSLVTATPVPRGAPITKDMLKVVRPGTGLSPHFFDAVVGLAPTRDLPVNTVLQWSHFK